ncbi:sensor histidine kinase [Paenibacillus sambharensis]|uniref:sensor histidine kinase n=1 Tax=Paenibacillus sambharensis TaxID=1803190 RepID=UPI00319EAEA3
MGKLRYKLTRLNTLRNQMLFGFLAVMLVILCIVGLITYDSVSRLLTNNAEKHIQQTAVQANGRLEAILQQVDMLTTQVATDVFVQQVMEKEKAGSRATFAERQALLPSVNIAEVYANGVHSVELFTTDYGRLYPLDGNSLDSKISYRWINEALENRGRLVWIGIDPYDPESVLAIRSVRLMNQWFSPGGYLLVRMNRAAFDISDSPREQQGRETMIVAGSDGKLIASNEKGLTGEAIQPLMEAEGPEVELSSRRYMMVKQESSVTGWTLLILTPMGEITMGVSVLQTAILVSAGIGTILFILFSFALSTIITRPVLKLIKTMRSMRFGVLQQAAEVSSTNEINELNRTYNQMVDNMNDLIRLVYQKEIMQSQTELKALQAQINPHFLFNTLEALYWSLLEKDEDELAEYVVTMSDLFRYTITGAGRDEWVTVGDELEHIERYLLIMKMRFGDRLTWSISSDPELAGFRLPKLLIQPVVENAILHGVEGKISPGTVSLTVSRTDEGLMFTVEDDGAGMDEDAVRRLEHSLARGERYSSKGSGVGLHNVANRIRLYFGGKTGGPGAASHTNGIQISSRRGEGTRIQITIPALTEVPK